MTQEKLSPRQKMIGMMYLVLTAMLALNVSKEAVKAFIRVDQGLMTTVKNYGIKNNLIYDEFTRADAENHTKAGKYKDAAFAVKERADEIFNYIQDLKIFIIKTADGAEKAVAEKAVIGSEYDIEKIGKYDDPNVPSQILIASNETGKGFALRTMINDYRNFLIQTLHENGGNTIAEDALNKSLTAEAGLNEDKVMEAWPNRMFQTMPVVGALALMSSIQVDVRNGETEVINHLYTEIDKSYFKFNKLQPIVIPDANYVTVGSNYNAAVFIMATDTTQQPNITVDNQVLPLDELGRGVYTVRAGSVGPKSWGGVITLRTGDGREMPYNFTASYTVGEPNVICSPTAMNVMYYGIPNPLDVSVPGFSPNQISINVINGAKTDERIKNVNGEEFKGNYFIKPNSPTQDVQIVVSTKDANGKTTTYKPYPFRVKRIPKAEAVFANASGGLVQKSVLLSQAGVFARLEGFDFNLPYKVTGFTVFYTGRTGDIEVPSTNDQLTQGQKSAMALMTRGQTLIIKDIKAVGPDGIPQALNALVFKVD
ncbi:MAG: gliding motility protein GldM [Bacteroidales bacterium]|jgi:gliding motility-associated protein GldM